MIKVILMLVVFWTGISMGAPASSPGQLPLPELETLPSGLQIAWFVSDQLPVVDLSLVVKGGHRDDPQGKSGTSELLMATLDRGSRGKSAQQIAHSSEMLGASRYVSANDDTMTVGIHGLAPDAEALLGILKDLALFP